MWKWSQNPPSDEEVCNGGGEGSATRGSINFSVNCTYCPRTICITITVTSGPELSGDNARDVFVMESNPSMSPTCLNPNSSSDVTNSIGRYDSPNGVPVTLGPIEVSSCATNFSVILLETGGGGTDTYTTGTVELVCPSLPPCALPYEDWKYTMRFNVTDTSGSGLTDYWVPINLSPSIFNYAKANASGADLRFTEDDETTILDYSIETWNPSGNSTVWVKVNVSASSTETFYMHYGNPCVGSESIAGNYSMPPPTVNLGQEEARHVRTDYFGGTTGISAMTNTTVSDGTVVLNGSPYNPTGNVTSTIMSLGDSNTWSIFYGNHSLPANTGIGYQVLRASDGSTLCTITAAQALLGYNVSGCADSISPIRLYANLSTTDGLATPYLQWWGIMKQ